MTTAGHDAALLRMKNLLAECIRARGSWTRKSGPVCIRNYFPRAVQTCWILEPKNSGHEGEDVNVLEKRESHARLYIGSDRVEDPVHRRKLTRIEAMFASHGRYS